jgi:hypothetical protein
VEVVVRSDLTARIQGAASLAGCDALAAEIVAERPDQIILLFADLYRRRAALEGEAGQGVQGEMHHWVAELLSAAFGASRGHDLRVLLEPGAAAGGDPMATWRTASPSVFAHYWTLAQDEQLPASVKAVLLQGLWELRPLWKRGGGSDMPRPIDVLRSAVPAHIDAASWVAAQAIDPAARGMLAAQHWKTAVRLSAEAGQPELVVAKLAELRAAQSAILAEAPHWTFRLVEVEVELAASRGRRRPDQVADERLEELLLLLEQVAAGLQRMRHMDHLDPDVLETRAEIERCLGRGPDQKESAKRRAQMLERQARSASSGIVASTRWKGAAAEFQQAGLREDATRAKAEARDALRRAEEGGEFQEVSVTITVDHDQHEAMLRPFFDGAADVGAVLRRIGSCLFVPSLVRGEPATSGPRSLTGQIAMTMPIVDDRSLAEIAPGTDEQLRFEERRALLQEIVFYSGFISELFEKLRDEFQVHQEDLVAHLAASPFVEPDDLPFLRTAADRYLFGDLIAALHVLVPRVEQMIRRILRAAGSEVTAQRDGELRERPLGELLRAAESDQVFSTALTRLLQAVLSEEWGRNLRNRVAHGLVTVGDCSQADVDRVLLIALHLAGLRLKEPAEERAEAPEPARM